MRKSLSGVLLLFVFLASSTAASPGNLLPEGFTRITIEQSSALGDALQPTKEGWSTGTLYVDGDGQPSVIIIGEKPLLLDDLPLVVCHNRNGWSTGRVWGDFSEAMGGKSRGLLHDPDQKKYPLANRSAAWGMDGVFFFLVPRTYAEEVLMDGMGVGKFLCGWPVGFRPTEKVMFLNEVPMALCSGSRKLISAIHRDRSDETLNAKYRIEGHFGITGDNYYADKQQYLLPKAYVNEVLAKDFPQLACTDYKT